MSAGILSGLRWRRIIPGFERFAGSDAGGPLLGFWMGGWEDGSGGSQTATYLERRLDNELEVSAVRCHGWLGICSRAANPEQRRLDPSPKR